MIVLINGRRTRRLDIADRGLQYGDGLFETVAVARGVPLLWPAHLQRLQHGCARLGIDPPDPAVVRAEADQLCAGRERAVLKIIVTRGLSGCGYLVASDATPTRVLSLAPWPDRPAQQAHTGVAVCWCRTALARQPRLAGLKHLNRLEQVLARAEWAAEYAEGLMRDTEGYVIEGTMSNLFLVARGVLHTPELSQSGVAGVMRAQVLDRARAAGIEWRETWLKPAELESADEIFLTNSLIGVWPVRSLSSREYAIGPITQTIQKALAAAGCVTLAR